MMNPVETKYRFAIWFSIDGDMCYLSHRDTLSFWQRAMARGQLPIKYSSGFNPHMRLSLPLPRSVGMASDRELLLVETFEYLAPEEVHNALSPQLPEGIMVHDVARIAFGFSVIPIWATYRLELTANIDLDELENKIDHFHGSAHCYVDRPQRGRHPRRRLDLREQVDSLELCDRSLHCKVRISPTGTARVNELCGVFGLVGPDHVCETRRLEAGYPEFLMASV